MDLSALHGKRLIAAAIFVAAVLVLAVQLITPSPVMVSIGDNGAQTTQLGQYFTYTDVALITVAASFLGASGTYLLLYDHTTVVPTNESAVPHTVATDGETPPIRQAVSDGQGSGTVQHDTTDPEERWEETVDRLHNNEETVYTVVLEAGGELPQRDIVKGTELSKATVSRTLDTLESKDLVERKRKGMGNVVALTEYWRTTG
ncbi:helix-turn-helix transcriptional regulator [Halopenitus persicus]|uniref:MarR family protein n=1 Tax=Halopenitus persicus TaxID=1048396 RepID=A0A1H3NXG4_9EURY|nr:MarR family transcriptional regulator [Halopenitus persicus]SDY93215.1 MarR family protein [Halopenitus persicus]